MLSSSLLASLVVLTTQTLAVNGQYASTTIPTAAISVTASAKTQQTTIASQLTAATAAAGTTGWEYSVTWPAGCESWANPCPPGAHISGGGVAGAASATAYTNGFTSYLTETDSNGVITGMPTKATVAAGVSTSATSAATTLVTKASSSSNSTVSLSSPSLTQTGFSAGETSSNGASRGVVASSTLLVVVAGLVTLLC